MLTDSEQVGIQVYEQHDYLLQSNYSVCFPREEQIHVLCSKQKLAVCQRLQPQGERGVVHHTQMGHAPQIKTPDQSVTSFRTYANGSS